MGYRKYAKDYHPRLVPDKDGRGMKEIYVYKGPRFVVSLRPPLQKEKVKRRLVLYPAAALAALILAGLLENRGMRAFYVAVPYVVALLPAVLTLAGGWYAQGGSRTVRIGMHNNSDVDVRANVLHMEGPVGVVQNQTHLGKAHLAALLGPAEDHVLHLAPP